MSNPHLATEQLLELLLTLKKTTPAAARGILNNQPAIAYALMTLMVSMNAINIEVFQKTLAEFGAGAPDPSAALSQASASASTAVVPQLLPPLAEPAPISAIPSHLQAQYRTTTPPSAPSSAAAPAHTPTPPYAYGASSAANGQHAPTPPGYGHGYGQPPPQQLGYPYQQQQQQYQYQQGGYGGYPSYGAHAPPQPQHQQLQAAPVAPTPTLPDALAGMQPEQKALIMRVLSMTPEQINMLPPAERATYIQIGDVGHFDRMTDST